MPHDWHFGYRDGSRWHSQPEWICRNCGHHRAAAVLDGTGLPVPPDDFLLVEVWSPIGAKLSCEELIIHKVMES